jgi:RNase P subunit RPR2
MMESQIDRVDVKSKKLDPIDEGAAKLYAQEVLAIVTPLVTSEGLKQYILSRTIEGIDSKDLTAFTMSEAQTKHYLNYLENVAKSYAQDTELAIKSVLEDGITKKLPAQEVKKNLGNVMNTDEYRVKRLAITETNRAGNNGSVYAMEQVQKETKVKINKIWKAQNGACEYCRALDGKKVSVTETFVAKGEEITGADGGVMTNNFVTMDIPTAHPNCSCYTTYEVQK